MPGSTSRRRSASPRSAGRRVLVSRLTEIAIGDRIRVELIMLVGLIFGPLACLILALAPGDFTLAVVFVLMFNAAMGVIAVARATLPLVLFGRAGLRRRCWGG